MDTIKIKYLDKEMSRLQHKGEWVDVFPGLDFYDAGE